MLNTSSKLHSRILVLLVIVTGCIVGFGLARALYFEKIKTVTIILIFPLLLLIPFMLSRVSPQTIISALLLLFWLPIRLDFIGELYFFECAVYCVFALAAMNSVVSRNSTSTPSFEGFPLPAFLFFVGGAILTYAISYKAGTELVRIRLFCLFPMFLCYLFFVSVRNEKDAERYLWMIYISASILALIFTMADRSFAFVESTGYDSASGRLSMILKISFLGVLQIFPAAAGTYFGMLLCVGYYLWISSVSKSKKLLIVGISLIFAVAIILGQGRGGAGAAVCSIALMSLLHFRKATTKTHFGIVLIGLIFFCTLIFGGMWYFASHSQHAGYNIRVAGLLNAPTSDQNLIGRIWLWTEGLSALLENPFGIGFYGLHTTLSGDTWDVHNFYLYLWLCLGPIGFFGFWGIIYKFYKTFRESMNSHNDSLRGLSILGLGCILFICLNGIVSPLVWSSYSVVIIWAPLGITYAACMREKNKSKTIASSVSSHPQGQIS